MTSFKPYVLSRSEIESYYLNTKPLQGYVSGSWHWARKHYRVETLKGRWIKLNRFENRINPRELWEWCRKIKPRHVCFSVLDWLFPEVVGKKYKASYAVPIGGEYAVDVDAYAGKSHIHEWRNQICLSCLELARAMSIQLCEHIEEYYSKLAVVFSGKRGFHIHILDFQLRDWTYYDERNPVKSHDVARFKFSRVLASDSLAMDRYHFIVATDPMRVMTVPWSLNAETGLICTMIGGRKDLEATSVGTLIDRSKATCYIHPAKTVYASSLLRIRQFHSYPEPYGR